jgi:uncharacterized membrane-anchored protein YitT (DUF2179 family)
MKKEFGEIFRKNENLRLLTSVIGAAIYALGLNWFIVPLNLYSGGMMGIAQLIRTFLSNSFGLQSGQLDLAGIFYYILNIPMVIMAVKMMDKLFVKKLLITLTACTIFLSVIPIPEKPILGEELTSCLIGGIICGFGIGLYLRAGGSAGGFEVLGIYLARTKPNFSVGKMNMIVNGVIYAVCLILFDPSVAVYSVIYSVFMSITMDKFHAQNIRVEAIILSKTNNDQIEAQILKRLGRGITCWKAKGGFTGENIDVLYTVLSKYEIGILKDIVYTANPQAFMVVKEGLSVDGNFIKRLS